VSPPALRIIRITPCVFDEIHTGALFRVFSKSCFFLRDSQNPATILQKTILQIVCCDRTARRFCTGHIAGLQCWTFAFEYCRLYPAAMTDKEQLCDLHDDNDDFKETKWPRDVCRAPCNKASSKRPYKFPTFRPSPSRFDRALRHGANDGEQT
jgi:hypothetical protein